MNPILISRYAPYMSDCTPEDWISTRCQATPSNRGEVMFVSASQAGRQSSGGNRRGSSGGEGGWPKAAWFLKGMGRYGVLLLPLSHCRP